MVAETDVSARNLIFPLFVLDYGQIDQPINSMPGISRLNPDSLFREIESCFEVGLRSFALFPVVDEVLKDKNAGKSFDPSFFYMKVIQDVKMRFPESVIISDVAMDPYSSDAHDGIYQEGRILNDETLPILAKMAVAQAQAGADIVGPSDMMDGRVGFIRDALDSAGHSEVSIMAYTAKYASGFYGPFRDALSSAPKKGDKKTYQMDPRNVREALIESELDEAEGADFLMVKPALAYLDVIQTLKQNSNLPIAAYNVSGEYAMIKAAAEKGWINEPVAVQETLTAMRRAGADLILTYFAKQFLQAR